MNFRVSKWKKSYIIEKLGQHNQWRKFQGGPYNSKGSANASLRQLRRKHGMEDDDIMQMLVSKPWDARIFNR